MVLLQIIKLLPICKAKIKGLQLPDQVNEPELNKAYSLLFLQMDPTQNHLVHKKNMTIAIGMVFHQINHSWYQESQYIFLGRLSNKEHFDQKSSYT